MGCNFQFRNRNESLFVSSTCRRRNCTISGRFGNCHVNCRHSSFNLKTTFNVVFFAKFAIKRISRDCVLTTRRKPRRQIDRQIYWNIFKLSSPAVKSAQASGEWPLFIVIFAAPCKTNHYRYTSRLHQAIRTRDSGFITRLVA